MNPPTPARQTLASAFVVAMLCALASPVVPAPEVPEQRPKVEFVQVEGLACLKPETKAADAKLDDFRAAELRWLAEHYPGSPAHFWKTELVLENGAGSDDTSTSTTVRRESARVELANGSAVTVCFDIGLAEGKKGSAD